MKQVGRELGVRMFGRQRTQGWEPGPHHRPAYRCRDRRAYLGRSFRRRAQDIFDLQDHVTASVVGAIGPKLRKVEIERARAKPTESIDAYDLFLRALALHNTLTVEANKEALRLLERAVAIDPDYASAYGLAAYCHLRQLQRGWGTSAVPGIERGIHSARLAAELGQDDPTRFGWLALFSQCWPVSSRAGWG